ncbi:hypothetical protein [Flexivirga sp. B27]
MKLYAAQPARVIRQVLYDVLTIAWLTAWVWLGIHVHQQIASSADGARKIERSGSDMARHLHDAAGILAHTPIVGDKVRKPVDKSADAATSLQRAGRELADNLGNLGAAVGFEIALVPVLVAIFGWLFLRIGYARRAGRAQRLRTLPGGGDLLALDALTRLPARKLATVSDRPVASWRAGDEAAIGDLADAYLRHLGLRAMPEIRTDAEVGDQPAGGTSDGRTSSAGGVQDEESADT